MNVLIIYGTTEGQTRKIASAVADHVRQRGNQARLIDSTDKPQDLDVGGFDAVVVAGSVHQGLHQASIIQFVRDHLAILQARPTAFVSVSLSMASDQAEDRLDATECANRFLDVTGWKPTVTHLVAGALRYTQYDFFKGWILKMIAGAKGGSTDTSRDHEFTDWHDLEAFADAFFDRVSEHLDDIDETSGKRRFGEEEEEEETEPPGPDQSASKN